MNKLAEALQRLWTALIFSAALAALVWLAWLSMQPNSAQKRFHSCTSISCITEREIPK